MGNVKKEVVLFLASFFSPSNLLMKRFKYAKSFFFDRVNSSLLKKEAGVSLNDIWY